MQLAAFPQAVHSDELRLEILFQGGTELLEAARGGNGSDLGILLSLGSGRRVGWLRSGGLEVDFGKRLGEVFVLDDHADVLGAVVVAGCGGVFRVYFDGPLVEVGGG